MHNLQAIYSEAAARAPWETAPTDEGGALASVRQFDEVVGAAIEALGCALGHADLAEASAILRGLRAASDAFGGTEWVLDPRPWDPPAELPDQGATNETGRVSI